MFCSLSGVGPFMIFIGLDEREPAGTPYDCSRSYERVRSYGWPSCTLFLLLHLPLDSLYLLFTPFHIYA